MPANDFELDTMNTDSEDATAREPLIHNEISESRRQGLDGDAGQQQPITITLKSAGKVVWLLTLSAGISGLLFGYDTGVVSSTLVSIGSDLDGHPLTTAQKSIITAVTSLFALFLAPVTGILADSYGRRSVILTANILFIIGALLQAFAGHVSTMVVGRAVVGAAIGLASCATPLYITELAPADIRGSLVTVQSLFVTGGQVVAYCLGWFLAHFPAGWRWMVGLGALPALLQLFLLTLMFDTPRWLAMAGHQDRARAVLEKVYGALGNDDRQVMVEFVVDGIYSELARENKSQRDSDSSSSGTKNSQRSFLETTKQLTFAPSNRRALTIACLLQALQQACGFNSLMYFSATIFALVGFASPIGTSLSVALTNFLLTVAAFAYIDTIGRRRILLRSIPLMISGLVICAVAFQFIHPTDDDNNNPTGGPFTDGAQNAPWPLVLLLSMIVYVAAYAIGLGCVPWQQSELFPISVRSLGSGVATATNWGSNFVIAATFLPMMDVLGASVTFLIYAAICLLGWICIWRIYPETAGLELEGVGEILATGFGVKDSVDRFKARQRQRAAVRGGRR